MLSLMAGLMALVGLGRAVYAKDYVVPLHDGKVKVKELNAAISGELHVVSLPTSTEINLNSAEGEDFCAR